MRSIGLKGGEDRLVSVIIPAYNRAWSLRKTVQSLFDQTYRPIECLLVDDGSTDNTADVVRDLIHAAPDGVEIRYFKQENGGANSARNRGLLESRGAYICFLDSDDWLLPDSVKTRTDALIADPEADFCYGLCSVQNESGQELRTMNSPWPAEGQARIAPYLFATASPLIRRTVCVHAGLWREDDLHGQEYEYFARIKYFSKKVVFLPRVLHVYLRHEEGNIFDLADHDFVRAIFRVLWAVKALIVCSPYDNPAERARLAREFKGVGKLFSKCKDDTSACAALTESLTLKWNPKVFTLWMWFHLLLLLKKTGLRS